MYAHLRKRKTCVTHMLPSLNISSLLSVEDPKECCISQKTIALPALREKIENACAAISGRSAQGYPWQFAILTDVKELLATTWSTSSSTSCD